MSSLLEEFLIKFGVEVDDKKIDKFRNNLQDISKNFLEITGLASLAQLSIGALAQKMTGSAAQIGFTAESLGISTDRLQQWNEAAKAAGASGDSLMSAMERANKAIGSINTAHPDVDFISKNATNQVNLEGIKNGEQYLLRISDLLRSIKDYNTRLSVASNLGFSEKDMLLLQKGSEFTKKFFTKDYVTYSKEYTKASQDINSSIDDTERQIKQLASSILSDLSPAIKEVVSGLQNWLKVNDGLIKENVKTFVVTLAKAMSLLAHNINLVLGALVAMYAPSVIAGISSLTTVLKANPIFAAVAGLTAYGLNNYNKYTSNPQTPDKSKNARGFIEHNLDPNTVFDRYRPHLQNNNQAMLNRIARDTRSSQPSTASPPINNNVNVTVHTNASDPQVVASLVEQKIKGHLSNVTQDIYKKNKSQVLA